MVKNGAFQGWTEQDEKYCRGCDYLGKTGSGRTCDFVSVTGRLRTAATNAPPGVGCPLHTGGKQKEKKKAEGDKKKMKKAKEVSFHQVVKQPETVDAASCRQVSELPETQGISAETAETQGTEASKTKPERSEAIRVREMFALLEKLVQAGLGDAPTQIDGTYIKDFYAVSILRTKDGISVDLTTMK